MWLTNVVGHYVEMTASRCHVAEIRTEAVMQALAMHNNKRPVMLPSKRTSVNYQGQQRRERQGEMSRHHHPSTPPWHLTPPPHLGISPPPPHLGISSPPPHLGISHPPPSHTRSCFCLLRYKETDSTLTLYHEDQTEL